MEDIKCYYSYDDMETALDNNEDVIRTTQIHFCSNKYIYIGEYTLYIHAENGKVVKIDKNGTDATNRELKEGHNIEKMLLSGEFGCDLFRYGNVVY